VDALLARGKLRMPGLSLARRGMQRTRIATEATPYPAEGDRVTVSPMVLLEGATSLKTKGPPLFRHRLRSAQGRDSGNGESQSCGPGRSARPARVKGFVSGTHDQIYEVILDTVPSVLLSLEVSWRVKSSKEGVGPATTEKHSGIKRLGTKGFEQGCARRTHV